MEDLNLDLLTLEKNHHVKDYTNLTFSSLFYPLIKRATGAVLINNIFVNKIEENYKCVVSFLQIFQITYRCL